MSASAAIAGVHRSTAYLARAQDEGFAAAWADAIETATDALEAEARKRATTGSDTLLIFLLKAHRPTFRERTQTEHTGGVTVRVVYDDGDPGSSAPAASGTEADTREHE